MFTPEGNRETLLALWRNDVTQITECAHIYNFEVILFIVLTFIYQIFDEVQAAETPASRREMQQVDLSASRISRRLLYFTVFPRRTKFRMKSLRVVMMMMRGGCGRRGAERLHRRRRDGVCLEAVEARLGTERRFRRRSELGRRIPGGIDSESDFRRLGAPSQPPRRLVGMQTVNRVHILVVVIT